VVPFHQFCPLSPFVPHPPPIPRSLTGHSINIWTVRNNSFSFGNFIQPTAVSNFYVSNILLSALFSSTLSQFAYLMSKTKKTQQYSFVYSNHYAFRLKEGTQKILPNGSRHSLNFNLFLISSCTQLWIVRVVTKYLNSVTFSRHVLRIPRLSMMLRDYSSYI